MEFNKKDIYFNNFVLFLSVVATLGLVISAAYFSVSGLAKTFAGASQEVLLMGSSLELAKIVLSLFLHFFWGRMHGLFKYWLSLFLVILIVITSMGIYGFLSNAFKETEAQFNSTLRKVELIEFKKKNFEKEIEQLEGQVEQFQSQIAVLNSSKESISTSLQNSSDFYEYIDQETGEKVRRPRSNDNRQILLTQLNGTDDKIETIQEKVSDLYKDMGVQRDSIYELDEKILYENMNNEASSELGPLIYIADLVDKPIASVVNVFMFILVFVFDPLAVTLVFATSYAFGYRSKNQNGQETKSIPLEDIQEDTANQPEVKTKIFVDSKVMKDYHKELLEEYRNAPEGRLKGKLKKDNPTLKKKEDEPVVENTKEVDQQEELKPEDRPKKNKIKAKKK